MDSNLVTAAAAALGSVMGAGASILILTAPPA
jgi:hypothetical protein